MSRRQTRSGSVLPPTVSASLPTPAKRLRCAVYTRASGEEGLGMEFNTLDAQRGACEAYVLSQRAEGWTLVPDRYDDGATRVGTWTAPPCAGSCPTSRPAGWTSWSPTSWTAPADR
ncbi:hypothetical protein [Muricoccus radiodurans]|uniref:hypothetical protein n=1 Tax=Muricoccus radiodurans TaxID=2231721 RepID=UPI003CF983E8